MWQQEVRGLSKFDDISITDQRLPVVRKLQVALLSQNPKNTYYFIKKWAQKQLKELQSSDQQQKQQALKQHKSLSQSKIKSNQFLKRRNAIVMAKTDQNDQWIQFINKQPLLKNQQCKSRIMISLRQIPFLVHLGWDDINQLVQQAQIREYYQNQVFVVKGQQINRLFILLNGQIIRKDLNGETIISQGKSLFVESIISLFTAKNNYNIASPKAWICGIQSYRIYSLVQSVNQQRQQKLQKILMNVGLFNCLDQQEFYKLICMIEQRSVAKSNDIVIQQNDPVSSFFIVLRGQFLLCKKNLSGDITSFHTSREGQYFGQQWLVKPVESECMVVAKTEGLLGVISRANIQAGISSIDRLMKRRKLKRLKSKQQK